MRLLRIFLVDLARMPREPRLGGLPPVFTIQPPDYNQAYRASDGG
jgi:hypothetical protein